MGHLGVFDGAAVWELHATHGLPVEFSIPLIAQRGYMVTWPPLLEAARRDGANVPRLVERLGEPVRAAYPDKAVIILEKLGALAEW